MSDEAIQVSCSTILSGADDPVEIFNSLQKLFPEVVVDELEDRPCSFPMPKEKVQWNFVNLNLDAILERMAEERILDTALDAMSQSLHQDSTIFKLSRQAAMANKISFCLNEEEPLGGSFRIKLSGKNLGKWLEDATWHQGRQMVPRSIGDDHRMSGDGASRSVF